VSDPRRRMPPDLSTIGFTLVLIVVISCMVCGGFGGFYAGVH
jgi:hypothetical protein